MRSKMWLGVFTSLLLGAIVGASGQVVPVKWTSEAMSSVNAVGAGAVAIGNGGVNLNPDQTTSRSSGDFRNAAVLTFSDPSCSAANRGEIRLWVVQGVAVDVDVDALCFCRQRTDSPGSMAETVSLAWACFNSSDAPSAV